MKQNQASDDNWMCKGPLLTSVFTGSMSTVAADILVSNLKMEEKTPWSRMLKALIYWKMLMWLWIWNLILSCPGGPCACVCFFDPEVWSREMMPHSDGVHTCCSPRYLHVRGLREQVLWSMMIKHGLKSWWGKVHLLRFVFSVVLLFLLGAGSIVSAHWEQP